MKKIITIITMILVLSGCSSQGSEDPLQFVWFSDGNEGEVMQSIIDDFTAETGIEIELVEVPYSDAMTKVTTMIQGGEPPALVRTALPVDLSPYAVDLTDILNTDDYYDAAYGNMEPDGSTITALPLDASSNGIIYNSDLFDSCGVELPTSDNIWTWPQFINEMKKLIGCDGVKYPGVFDMTAGRFSTMIYQYGGRIISEDGSTALINSPEAYDGFKTFEQLTEDGILDPTIWAGSGDASSLFRTGQYGFHWAGSWMLSQYSDLPFDWDVTYMPRGETKEGQRSSFYGGKYIMALDGSGQEEEAKQFIEYFSQPEVHDKFSSETLLMSPRKDSTATYGDFDDQIALFNNELENTPISQSEDWTNPVINEIQQDLVDTVNECIAKPDDTQIILDEFNETIQEKIDEE